ncbi:MAG: tryptophan 2,3-dioxygenase [Alphaproteobacteria bacterium]|nr:MAG: tryptophan 2,3-dioxygenase [Alphaproteobacteria bacterium]
MSKDTKKAGHLNLEGERIHWDQDMSYGQYLGLDKLLAAQNPLSGEHDEMLFIIIHQASELWMKLSIHELTAAREEIKKDNLRPSFKMLSRVARIQTQLLQSWDVLATMTPSDYTKLRAHLGKSSGLQSAQYRVIEFLLGNKNAELLRLQENNPDGLKALKAVLDAPSLYDETLRLLKKRGFDIPEDKLERDWTLAYSADKKVEDAWLKIYQNSEKYWDIYELAEKLVDLEYHFQLWRYAHLKTVERIIGFKRGTGGSSGVPYLARALENSFFPELWSVRTRM